MFSFFKKSNKKLEFTKKFYNRLKKEIKELQLLSLKELEIKTSYKENKHTHYLVNAYTEYTRDIENEATIIERYIKSALDTYEVSERVFRANKIVPRIQGKPYIEKIKRATNLNDIDFIYEKYNEELYIFYAQDSDNSIFYLLKNHLLKLGIEEEMLRKIAVNNLIELIPDIKRHGQNGYYMLVAGGDYEACLILDKTIWRKENFPIKGEILVGIPSRDLLLITGSEDPTNINRLKSTIKDIYKTGSYPVSDKIFIYKNEQFELYE